MGENWPRAKIGECCDILDNLRVPLNAEERDNIQGDIPYYGANGLQGYIDKFIFDEPLILLAEDGGYFDEYESRPIAYKISGKSWVNNHAHILRAKAGSSFSQDFIFYCLEHKNIMPFIKGGTRAKLNQSELREILIPKPPEPIQRRIAEILSTLDETIEQTEALIAKYQQIKAGLMHDLFTRGVTSDGRLRPTRAQAPHLYKESPVGWIPKEWRYKCLSDTCELLKDGTHLPPIRVSSGPLLLSVQNMIDGHLSLTNNDTRVSEDFFAQMHKSWSIKPHDVLLAIVGATIGKVCRVPENFPKFTLQRSVAILRGRQRLLSSQYLYWFLLTPAFKNLLWERVNQTAQPGIYLDQIGKIIVPIPLEKEQCAISEKFEAVADSIEATKDELAKLRQQKHGLMHDLLTGRVRVKVDASGGSDGAV